MSEPQPAPKQYGFYTQENLQKLADQENVTVMQHDYENHYEPLDATRVRACVTKLVDIMRTCPERVDGIVQSDDELRDFASKYLVFYKNLTNAEFVRDPENIRLMLSMVELRAAVERGEADPQAAQAMSCDVALRSILSRAESQRRAAAQSGSHAPGAAPDDDDSARVVELPSSE